MQQESTLRSILHLDKLLKRTSEKRSVERSYLKDTSKAAEIDHSTYYKSKY